jgi:predicted nucleic acid-binding protein
VRRAFVDTSGFFALLVRDDDHHEPAQELFARAERERWRLLPTNFVVFETHTLLLNRVRSGREIALAFLDRFPDDKVQVIRFRRADVDKAFAIIRSHRDKEYSLCDAHSFAAMERLKIRDVISFDSDFRSYGRFDVL